MGNLFSKYAIGLLALMAVAGCDTIQTIGENGKSQAYEQQAAFPDLPIPQKSKIIPEKSLILGRDKSMTGRITVESEFSVDKVFIYYQQQMPSAGWKEVTSLQGDISIIIFSKPERIANITVRPKTGISSGAIIEISVSPNRTNAAPTSLIN